MRAAAARLARILTISVILGAAGLAGCDGQDTGYVDIVLAGGLPAERRLYLGSTPVSGHGHVLLHRSVGTVALKDREWFGEEYCRIRVRKDRLTTVTVRIVNQRPRCDCEIRAPESTAEIPTCQ
jgi:hypothetical protein